MLISRQNSSTLPKSCGTSATASSWAWSTIGYPAASSRTSASAKMSRAVAWVRILRPGPAICMCVNPLAVNLGLKGKRGPFRRFAILVEPRHLPIDNSRIRIAQRPTARQLYPQKRAGLEETQRPARRCASRVIQSFECAILQLSPERYDLRVSSAPIKLEAVGRLVAQPQRRSSAPCFGTLLPHHQILAPAPLPSRLSEPARQPSIARRRTHEHSRVDKYRIRREYHARETHRASIARQRAMPIPVI